MARMLAALTDTAEPIRCPLLPLLPATPLPFSTGRPSLVHVRFAALRVSMDPLAGPGGTVRATDGAAAEDLMRWRAERVQAAIRELKRREVVLVLTTETLPHDVGEHSPGSGPGAWAPGF